MSTRRRTASGALPVAALRYALPARRAGGGGARRCRARASPLAAGETRALHDLAEASAFRAGKVVGGPFTSSNRADPRPIEFRPMSESLDAAIPGGSASGPNPRPMARATCRGSANCARASRCLRSVHGRDRGLRGRRHRAAGADAGDRAPDRAGLDPGRWRLDTGAGRRPDHGDGGCRGLRRGTARLRDRPRTLAEGRGAREAAPARKSAVPPHARRRPRAPLRGGP